MQLGWIDFSETDRKQALGILTQLDEQGAVDEIGIGRIRDAFANIFFPGTSTIMTRAKYYFIAFWCFGKDQEIKIERLLLCYPFSRDEFFIRAAHKKTFALSSYIGSATSRRTFGICFPRVWRCSGVEGFVY